MKSYLRHTRARMFESEVLEVFSKTHPVIPFVFWVPVAVALPVYAVATGIAGLGEVAGFGALGALGWQVTEYFVHRDFFHWQGIGPRTRRLHDIVHGYHHKYPDDPGRLVMPLAVSLFIAVLLAGALALLERPTFTVPFFTGFLWGYLWYDFMHWSTHFRAPLTAWGRLMRAHHMAHHFADVDSNFGISHRWLDRLMGTRRR
ncbi:MAG: sterol desaturase family protein [Myxococcaceae bacterium]|nr:sterol desaturase family protein [Myxococcaceae bacterium]